MSWPKSEKAIAEAQPSALDLDSGHGIESLLLRVKFRTSRR